MTVEPFMKFKPARFVIETLVVLIPVVGVMLPMMGFAAQEIPTSKMRAGMKRNNVIERRDFSSI